MMSLLRPSALCFLFVAACAPAQPPCPPCNAAAEAEPLAAPEAECLAGDVTEKTPAVADAGAPKRDQDAPEKKRPGLTVAETRTQKVIADVVKANRQRVRTCYEKALAKSPGLRGTLTLHFTINPEGKVTAAEVNDSRSDMDVPGLAECALAAIRGVRFPQSSRGFESNVNYPFDFKPGT